MSVAPTDLPVVPRWPMACTEPRTFKFGIGPCGMCDACIAYRKRKWVRRALTEIMDHPKNWFVTFTFRDGASFNYAEFQKCVKRWRKKGHLIRYMIVSELGEKNNRLHYHAILHGDEKLTWRSINQEWKEGFTHKKELRTNREALQKTKYMCKYVVKGSKPKSSQGYGTKPIRKLHENELVKACLETFPNSYVKQVRTQVGLSVRPLYVRYTTSDEISDFTSECNSEEVSEHKYC